MYEQSKIKVQKGFSILLRWIIFCKSKPKEAVSEIEEIDRISELPEFIVHRILSSLNTRVPAELVRMSVLSKTWFELTASFPNLVFYINDFSSRKSFFKYIEYTTSRFCHQNVTAHTIELVATFREPAELDIVNRCFELVLKKGVKVLAINVTKFSKSSSASAKPMLKYHLPNILLSVSILKTLIIRGCELPSSFMVDVIKFKSLVHLSLAKVHINDEGIKYLTTSCPLLKAFDFRSCHGFKTFCVYGHQNLKKVWIHYNTPVERIDIEARKLFDLTVVDMHKRGPPPMNLASCKKLKTVTYFGHPSPNTNGSNNFLSNFPFVENMFLVTTEYKCNNLKWSSHSLKTLMLAAHYDLEEIELNTPNLVLFVHACDYDAVRLMALNKGWSLLKDSTHLKACMQCYPPDFYIDTLWFKKLRRFLDKNSGFKVLNLYIHAIYTEKVLALEKLKAIELPPYELEHVELQLLVRDREIKESWAHIPYVDVVLWCFRPRSLTLRSLFYETDFEEQGDLVKFTCEKLLQQEDQGRTKIQIVSPSSSQAQKHLRDLKSLSMALPRAGYAVTFIKEEVVQEEAG